MAYSDYKENIFLIWMNLMMISRGDVTCMMVSASFGYIHFRLVNYDQRLMIMALIIAFMVYRFFFVKAVGLL